MMNIIRTYLILIYKFWRTKKKKRAIKAFYKSKKQIIEGIKNYSIKNKDIENVARYRMLICQECEMYSNNDEHCVIENTTPCCIECGCSLIFKVYSLSTSCPLNKWTQLITDIQELEYLTKE